MCSGERLGVPNRDPAVGAQERRCASARWWRGRVLLRPISTLANALVYLGQFYLGQVLRRAGSTWARFYLGQVLLRPGSTQANFLF